MLKMTLFTTKVGPGQNGNQNGTRKTFSASRKCPACSGQRGLRKCDKFKKLSYADREKSVLSKRPCFKCLNGEHFKDRCPKETFKCQVQGCVENNNTLLHPTPREQVERVSSASINNLDGSPPSAEDRHLQNSPATSESGGQVRSNKALVRLL